MTDKLKFKGKAIYQPTGKAEEYGVFACNFYNGCSNECTYCYCRNDYPFSRLWSNTPTLKKCFKDNVHAIETFRKELLQNLTELRNYGLFFSFVTDALLPETMELTVKAVKLCMDNGINVKILTKRSDFMTAFFKLLSAETSLQEEQLHPIYSKHIAFGFTLTGHDELEKGAPPNQERIQAMEKLYKKGYHIFVSAEPIVDFQSSMQMIKDSLSFCDLYKVGLMSRQKYDPVEAQAFLNELEQLSEHPKIYLKDSLMELLRIDRNTLPSNFVLKDYNIFI